MTTWLEEQVELAQRREARRLRYSARAIPVGTVLEARDRYGGKPLVVFNQFSFAVQSAQLNDPAAAPVPVLLDHDPARPVGVVERIRSGGDWVRVDFRLDLDTARGEFAWHHLQNRVGDDAFRPQPVSAAYVVEQAMPAGLLPDGAAVIRAELLELSLLVNRSPVFRGARVERAYEQTRPASGSSPPGGPGAAASAAGRPRILVRDCGEILSDR